ncbi:MAG: spore coat protein [Treponema sp.]|jgi:spore coat polysaccharide biosynthesis protein SpsF|nr:spore coat protein [Treponema sp.]
MSAVNLAIVLQARTDSSRLPGKSLLPLGGGEGVIFHVMKALNRIPAELRILACPEDSVGAFAPLAAEAGFTLFTGPKDDVLGRYCLALRKFGIQRVIRATGDNPFVFADAAAVINAEALALNADYAGYSGLPLGAGVESVSAAALLRTEAEASAPYEREHVCPYLYTHPELFSLHRPLAPVRWQGADIRLTIDTQEDYERAQAFYAALDRLENTGKLSGEERYRGAAIINAYRAMFPAADSGAAS